MQRHEVLVSPRSCSVPRRPPERIGGAICEHGGELWFVFIAHDGLPCCLPTHLPTNERLAAQRLLASIENVADCYLRQSVEAAR